MISRFNPRNGIERREVALIIAVVCVILAIGLPYLYRQRYFARRTVCEARHYRASLAIIQTAIDHGKFPGYRNLQAVDANGNPQASSWVFSILPYIHPLNDNLTFPPQNRPAELGGDKWLYLSDHIGPIGSQGPYITVFDEFGASGALETRGTKPVLYIPELMCPDDHQSGSNRESLLSIVANCGMPDTTATTEFPADWRTNGVFTDQFPGSWKSESPTTLDFLESKDGLSNIVMLSENVDAGLWTDSTESKVGFVWTVRHTDAPQTLFKEVWNFDESVGEGKGTIHSARPSSGHIQGFNIALCNGATRYISDDIDHLAWIWMLMTDSADPRYPGTTKVLAAPLLRPNTVPVEPDEGGAQPDGPVGNQDDGND